MTSTPELTTRDVLHQIDRRLTLIEEDLRTLHIETVSGLQRLDTKIDAKVGDAYHRLDAKIDARFGELDAKIDARFGELDAKIDARFGTLDTKIDARFGELDAKINIKIAGLDTKIDAHLRWTLGIVLASWLSLMGAVLLK